MGGHDRAKGAPLHLDAEALDALGIGAGAAADAIEAVIAAAVAGRAWAAPKTALHPPDGRTVMSMIAVADDPPVVAVKALVLSAANAERALPEINATVLLLDAATGCALATLDGNWITATRTAALAMVAGRWLARPDASRAAFVGAGVQARANLRAMAELFPLTGVSVFGRGAVNLRLFQDLAERLGLEVTVVSDAASAVAGADLVVTSVSQSGAFAPALDPRGLEPGVFVAMVDLGRSWDRAGLAAFDRLVVDDLAQERAMADPLVPLECSAGDLCGLVTGAFPGRQEPSERAAFVSRGHALGDLALAALAWRLHCGQPAQRDPAF
ncbi:ornithine cyclodeaminase family protein [Albidovulum sp.]|uniref:ornithine cyclodeaminase family protein n=1 Tax=Albidovulum sp. TaxID=1872424 RepID=UPI003D7E1B77